MIEPCRQWILARRDKQAAERAGLVIPEKYRDECPTAVIEKCGPGEVIDIIDGEPVYSGMEFAGGDRIVIIKNGGVEIEVDGKPLTLIRPDEIAAKILGGIHAVED